MQHKFSKFVEAIQGAVVNANKAITQENEKIIDQYFFVEESEVLLENEGYHKELYDYVTTLKSNLFFEQNTLRRAIYDKLNFKPLDHTRKDYITNVVLNEDDIILANLYALIAGKEKELSEFIKDSSVKGANDVKAKQQEIEILEFDLEKSIAQLDEVRLHLSEVKEGHAGDSTLEIIQQNIEKALYFEEKITSWISAKIPIKSDQIKNDIAEINSFLNIEKSYGNLPNYIASIISYRNRNEKLLHEYAKSPDLDEYMKGVYKEIATFEKAVIDQKQKIANEKVQLELLVKIDAESNKYFPQFNAAHEAVKGVQSFKDTLLKDIKGKIKESGISDFLKVGLALVVAVKRYKVKKIESYVPKTVRINYPATFDFGTPNNDKDFKVLSTPIEVPLITLVPITACTIEKATFKSNFKFSMDGDDVNVEFSNDKFEENATSSNFGSLEIVLSPTQTPEGLKAMIETYENFLKRQIV